MTHQYATLADTVYFWFGANDTAGSGNDGATPVYDVRLAGAAAAAAPVLSGSATLLSHANYPAGAHEVAIEATTGNGFVAGSTYGVFCTLLIDSQNPTGFVGSFTLGPVPANLKTWLGTAPLALASQRPQVDIRALAGSTQAVSTFGLGLDPLYALAALFGIEVDQGTASVIVTGHYVFEQLATLSWTNGTYRIYNNGGVWDLILVADDTILYRCEDATPFGTWAAYQEPYTGVPLASFVTTAMPVDIRTVLSSIPQTLLGDANAAAAYSASASASAASADGKCTTIAADVAGLDGAAMRGTDGAYTGTPPTTEQIKTAMEAEGGHLAEILTDTGTTIPATLATITEYVDCLPATWVTVPTAAENAAACWTLVNGIETGVTPKQALQRIGATTAGKASGGGTSTEIFVGMDGATTRVTATVDGSGNRTAITYA